MKKYTRIPTYIKYFLSYMLVLTVLMLGSYAIIRRQIVDSYFEKRSDHIETQLSNIAQQFTDDLNFLSQLNYVFDSNSVLIQSSCKEELSDKEFYKVNTELRKYVSFSQIVNSIVYMSKTNEIPFSTYLPVAWENGVFRIGGNYSGGDVLEFDPMLYMNAGSGCLLYRQGYSNNYLIYLPALSPQSNDIYFYILGTTGIQLKLQGLISEEVLAAGLISGEGKIVTGGNIGALESRLENMPLTAGNYELDSGETLCVVDGIGKDFVLAAVLSDEFLKEQVSDAFTGAYLALALLSVIGFALVMIAMKMTYQPLYRLTRKLAPNAQSGRYHLEELDQVFANAASENQLMKVKLDNYRFSIQKSLLDSVVAASSGEDVAVSPNVPDRFFEQRPDKKIFALQICSSTGLLLEERFETRLKKEIPDIDTCVMLEHRAGRAVYLIDYTGEEQDKEGVLFDVLCMLYKEEGWLAALSNGSASPLDIPALYRNVVEAGHSWPQNPVAVYRQQAAETSTYDYPHDSLEKLSEALEGNDFAVADQVLDELIDVIDSCKPEDSGLLQDFFIPCLLIDILMLLTNRMNQSKIPFQDYSELYYELLYLCRSCSYFEKRGEITEGLKRLLGIYEEKVDEVLNTVSIRQVMEECYCQPDFSITVLAERFGTNTSRMSYIFKKGQNINFADYLWELRLKKAKELLLSTDAPVEEISVAVGYYSVSGFRRKFKQATGYTPSEYRECAAGGTLQENHK